MPTEASAAPAVDPARPPTIRLVGPTNEAMLQRLLDGLDAAAGKAEPILLELQTSGGEADIGRRIALEIKLALARFGDRPFAFLGKTQVYSAGVTIMAAFPRARRFLTRDAMLLVHERRIEKNVAFCGPARAVLQQARQIVAEAESAIALEDEGFRDLVAGSATTLEALRERALGGAYLPAEEARAMGLVEALVG